MNHVEEDPVSTTLSALHRRLEGIRLEQLAKNRSHLRIFSAEQLQVVERSMAAITARIMVEVASEVEHSAAEGNGRRVSETITMMLGLA